MLIEICKDVFEGSDFQSLDMLIRIFSYKGRYDWFIDFKKIENSNFYRNLSVEDKANIEEQYNRFVNNSRIPDFHISELGGGTFNLDEAIIFFTQPVIILLENRRHDGYFVRSIIKHLDKKNKLDGKKKLTEHLNNNWIKFGNSGGANNFINWVFDELRNYRKLPKDNYKYLRIFVLCDSDKKYPEMDLGDSLKDTITFLAENNVPYHILEKREIENYLPDEAVRTIQTNEEYIDAYLRLKNIQKDYFDIEKGFTNKKIDKSSDGVKKLYESVNNNDIAIFEKKNLKKFLPHSKKETFKSNFPKLFLSKEVTKETLLKRCAHHIDNPKELPDLVKRIAKLL